MCCVFLERVWKLGEKAARRKNIFPQIAWRARGLREKTERE
jgi:hypothetical protein